MSDLDRRLRELDRVPAPDQWAAIRLGRPKKETFGTPAARTPSQGRRLVAALVALAIGIGGTVVVVRAFHSSRRPAAPRPASVTPPTSTSPVAALPTLPVRRTLHLPVTGFDVVGDGSEVWVASYGRVFGVDPTTMTVTKTIPVRRLDDQDSIAASSGTVWVPVGSRGVVVAIDEVTGKVIRTLKIPGSGYPMEVAADGTDVWVVSATGLPAVLTHIDAATWRVTSQTSLMSSPRMPIAAGDGAIWIGQAGGLWKVLPDGSATQVPSVGTVMAAAFADGAVWVSTDSVILRLDPANGRVDARIPTSVVELAPSGSVMLGLICCGRSSILAIDMASNRLVGHATRVGGHPSWIAGVAGSGFFLDYEAGTLVRIGGLGGG